MRRRPPCSRRRPGCARRRSREEHRQPVPPPSGPHPRRSCSPPPPPSARQRRPGPRAPPAPAPTPVTRAALDPALVAGRGAAVDFLEQEAENAATNGTVIGPDRTAYTLPAEASGRTAVKLAPGQYVEFTLPKAANAITVRYSIPDAPNGGGITAPLDVTVNGTGKRTMTLTSQYAWLYNQYPFTNDPNAGLLHPDWWITECECVPAATTPTPAITKPFRPMHFYDEQRAAARPDLPGRRQGPADRAGRDNAAWTVIDLLDSELVGLPHVRLMAANVLLFGADPTGTRDSADAFDRAIAFAQKKRPEGLHPAGHLPGQPAHHRRRRDDRGRRQLVHDHQGHGGRAADPRAGRLGAHRRRLLRQGRADGGSRNVHLSGFAIEGDVRERIDTDQVNGIGGAMSDSTIDGLYIRHTKVGLWFDGPMNNVDVTNNIIVDQIADALNFHTGVTNSGRVEQLRPQHRRRRPGDVVGERPRTPATRSTTTPCRRRRWPTASPSTAAPTTRLEQPRRRPDPRGQRHPRRSRFGAEPFTGHLWITDNTTVRAGTYELNWNIGLGAIWFYALENNIDADIQVVGDHFLDNTYNAIMLVTDWPVKDLYSITNVHFKDIRVDGTGTSVVSARVAGSASFENVDARNVGAVGVNNCGSFNFPPAGSEFSLTDLGGNDGGGTTGPWLAPWELPNTITCDDRPPVVAPPAPSPW